MGRVVGFAILFGQMAPEMWSILLLVFLLHQRTRQLERMERTLERPVRQLQRRQRELLELLQRGQRTLQDQAL